MTAASSLTAALVLLAVSANILLPFQLPTLCQYTTVLSMDVYRRNHAGPGLSRTFSVALKLNLSFKLAFGSIEFVFKTIIYVAAKPN